MNERQVHLGRSAARGLTAGASAQVVRLAIQLGSVAVLARILTPTDFGLVAMVLAVIGMADLLREMGLSAAAIQAERLSDDMRSNLWWINAGLGLAAMLLVAGVAPLLAWGYGQHVLMIIGWSLAPMFLINGLTAQYRVSLVRGLRFEALAVIDIAAQFLGVVAAVLVGLVGGGWRAVVAQQLVSPIISLVLMAWLASWRPARFVRGIGTMAYIRFGWAVLGSGLLTAFTLNFDGMLIGKLFGPASAGLYNRSVQMVRSPLKQVTAPFGNVMLPMMSRAQNDPERLGDMARMTQLFSGLPLAAASALFIGAGHEIVLVFLGSAWGGAGPIVGFIAVSTFFATIASVGSTIMIAQGLGRQLTMLAAYTTAVDVVLVAGGAFWGLLGVAGGVACAPACNWIFSLRWVERHSGVRTAPLQRQGIILASVTIVTGLLVRALLHVLPWDAVLVRLAVAAVTVICGLATLLLSADVRRDLNRGLQLFRTRRDTSPE